MPIIASRVTVTASATLVVQPLRGGVVDPITATLRNAGGVSVFLGGAAVTAAAGYELAPGGSFNVDLVAGDDLYAITSADTSTLHVLRFRQ
jgi:hypothetical protein